MSLPWDCELPEGLPRGVFPLCLPQPSKELCLQYVLNKWPTEQAESCCEAFLSMPCGLCPRIYPRDGECASSLNSWFFARQENLAGLVEGVVSKMKLVFCPHVPAPSRGFRLSGRSSQSTVHVRHRASLFPAPPFLSSDSHSAAMCWGSHLSRLFPSATSLHSSTP